MDTCSLTPEQVQLLIQGKSVQIKYHTLEEHGYAALTKLNWCP